MKKILLILLTISISLVAYRVDPQAQDNGNNEKELFVEEYYPIMENTKYLYEGEGNEYASYSVFVDYILDNSFQLRINNGGTESIHVLELKDDQLFLLYSRGETYFRHNFLSKEYNDVKTLIKGPLDLDNTWDYDENTRASITALSENIETPHDNYQAIEVTIEGQEGKSINYYAKDIGLVKTIFSGEGYEVSSTLSSIEKNIPLVQTISLYYPNIDGYLASKDVEIEFFTNTEPKDIIEEIIKDLSDYELFSSNTKINELYFDEEGESVHIDLSEDFIKEMNLGASFESLVLQSLTNTLGDYYDVQKVYISIDGGPYESGHIIIPQGEPSIVDYENVIGQ